MCLMHNFDFKARPGVAGACSQQEAEVESLEFKITAGLTVKFQHG